MGEKKLFSGWLGSGRTYSCRPKSARSVKQTFPGPVDQDKVGAMPRFTYDPAPYCENVTRMRLSFLYSETAVCRKKLHVPLVKLQIFFLRLTFPGPATLSRRTRRWSSSATWRGSPSWSGAPTPSPTCSLSRLGQESFIRFALGPIAIKEQFQFIDFCS